MFKLVICVFLSYLSENCASNQVQSTFDILSMISVISKACQQGPASIIKHPKRDMLGKVSKNYKLTLASLHSARV